MVDEINRRPVQVVLDAQKFVETFVRKPGPQEHRDFYEGDVPLSFHPAATRVLGLVTPRSVG